MLQKRALVWFCGPQLNACPHPIAVIKTFLRDGWTVTPSFPALWYLLPTPLLRAFWHSRQSCLQAGNLDFPTAIVRHGTIADQWFELPPTQHRQYGRSNCYRLIAGIVQSQRLQSPARRSYIWPAVKHYSKRGWRREPAVRNC